MTHREPLPQTMVLAACCVILLALPFVTTYNDLLTVGAMHTGFAAALQSVSPFEARMVVALLRAIGVQATVAGSQLVVIGPGGPTNLFISWNCIGWQSLVLLGMSLYVGLRGETTHEARAQVVLAGVLGTLLVNLLRVTLVCLLAATAGHWPAVIFHDYAGTLMTITWLFAFWAGAQRWLL